MFKGQMQTEKTVLLPPFTAVIILLGRLVHKSLLAGLGNVISSCLLQMEL